jgi:hypothetical protein
MRSRSNASPRWRPGLRIRAVRAIPGWAARERAVWGGLLGALVLGAAGCSVQKLVVASMVPVIDDSMVEAYASGDVQTVREGLPGQILLLRGLCRSDPARLETWTAATQLYASFAIIFVEDEDPQRAARLYAEGKDLGLRYLRRLDWFDQAWQAGPDALRDAIAARAPRDLAPLMTWTAVCLGKHVLGHLDTPRELADLPYVHVLGDAAISLAPEYSFGMPYVLKALMLTLTPPMLGGDLEQADRLFQRAFDLTGRGFHIYQVFYARYFCTASLREDLFDTVLHEVLDAPEDFAPETRLVNLVAREQAARLMAAKSDLF